METETINDYLEKDERILWSGKSVKTSFMDKPYAINFIIKLIICIALTLLVVIICIKNAEANPKVIGVALIMIAINAYVVFRNIKDKRDVEKYEYYLTDKRVISFSRYPQSVEYKNIDKYRFADDENGITTLLMGNSTIKKTASSYRSLGSYPFVPDPDTGMISRAVLFGIQDVERFKEIFESHV